MPSNIYTVFLHGTLSGREDRSWKALQYPEGELISVLAQDFRDQYSRESETYDWIEVNGPGTASKMMAGDMYSQSNAEDARNIGHGAWGILGVATGAGWGNTASGVAQLILNGGDSKQRQLYRKNNPVTKVNIIGWSRGGITAFMLAHKLQSGIFSTNTVQEVNIIAIDPVGGPGDWGLDGTTRTLPRNVKNFAGFYARDENSAGFCSTLPRNTNAAYHTYVMPGTHTTVVGDSRTAPDVKAGVVSITAGTQTRTRQLSLRETGQIVKLRSINFLREWGSVCNNWMRSDDGYILKIYDDMMPKDWQYRQLRNTDLTSGLKTTNVTTERTGAFGTGIGNYAQARRNYRPGYLYGTYQTLDAGADLSPELKPFFINKDHYDLYRSVGRDRQEIVAPNTYGALYKYGGEAFADM
jgi:hypothetical protein